MQCPSCKGTEIAEDCSQSLVQLICMNCATVLNVKEEFHSPDEFALGTQEVQFQDGELGNSVHRCQSLRRHGGEKGRPGPYRDALACLHELAAHCGVSRVMTVEAADLFKEAYDKPQLKYLRAIKKMWLAGSCVYVIVRKYGWPISISYVSTFLGIPASDINDVFKLLLETFSIVVTAPDPEDLVQNYVRQLGVSDLSSQEMIDRMQKILQLSKSTLLSTGVAVQQLLIAVCYISWCSLYVRTKKLPTFTAFCKDRNLSYFLNKTARRRVVELTKMLIDLANNIPSLAGGVIDKNSIFWHVETILKFPRVSARLESEDGEERTYTFRRHSSRRKPEASDECDDTDQQKELLEVKHDLNATELSELDIPDSEMHKYLRNDEQLDVAKYLLEHNEVQKRLLK